MTPEKLLDYRKELFNVSRSLKIEPKYVYNALCKKEEEFLKEFENLTTDQTLKKLAAIKLYLLAKAEHPIFDVYSQQADLNEIYNELNGLYDREQQLSDTKKE